ncbi:MAG: leucine-rich repeat domain-containing protein [Clostridiales bacterium]|nr:leucine-rich repeat domain-containing protein [Clostridiales bacterium]
MNKIIRLCPILLITICLVVLIFICTGNAFAESSGSCGDGLTWTLSDDGSLQISGSGDLKPGNWDEDGIVRVSIPEGVTSIEEAMFLNCKNFIGYDVAASNNNYASENGVLFNKDKTILIRFPSGLDGSYTIPGTVKSLSEGAFALCEKLTSVKMPDSVTSMGSYAFNCCSGLTSIQLSNSLKVIPRDCFSNSSSLKSITIPGGVTRIESSAFWGCSSLTTVILPTTIEDKGIAEDAFEGCSLDEESQKAVSKKLNSNDPDKVGTDLEVGDKADYQLEATIKGDAIDRYFYAESSDESVIKVKSLTRNGSINYANAVKYFYVLGVEAVGPGKATVTVYGSNDKLTVISITEFTVTGEAPEPTGPEVPQESFATGFTVEAGAQKDCSGESSVKGSLIETPFAAESSDRSIVEIVSIARGGNVIYSDAVTYFYTITVKGIKPGKTEITLYTDNTKQKKIASTTITVTGDAAEEPTGQKTVKTVTVGNGVYKLSGSTASLSKPKNKNVTKISIPATVSANGKKYKVTSVSANACKGSKKLKTLSIGKNVKSIGKKSFSGCGALSAVSGGSRLEKIGASAFKDCKVLTKITLNKKVKSIGSSAFSGCKKLKTITIKTTKLTSKNVGANAFKGTPAKATVTVPKEVKKAYSKWLVKKGISKKAKIK